MCCLFVLTTLCVVDIMGWREDREGRDTDTGPVASELEPLPEPGPDPVS